MENLIKENTTIEYYYRNSDMFIKTTIDAEMNALYNDVEKYLFTGDSIIDIGCGSGRDSNIFLKKDIFFEAEFDAVWAYVKKDTRINAFTDIDLIRKN